MNPNERSCSFSNGETNPAYQFYVNVCNVPGKMRQIDGTDSHFHRHTPAHTLSPSFRNIDPQLMQDTEINTYVENSKENEECIDNECHDIWQSSEGERHVYVWVGQEVSALVLAARIESRRARCVYQTKWLRKGQTVDDYCMNNINCEISYRSLNIYQRAWRLK